MDLFVDGVSIDKGKKSSSNYSLELRVNWVSRFRNFTYAGVQLAALKSYFDSFPTSRRHFLFLPGNFAELRA